MQHFFFRSRFSGRALVVCAALLASCATAFASPRSDAWKLRRSDPAEATRQLEAVVASDPRDAKAYWFLTLIYKDQNRDADALRALNSARAADPSLSFSSADSIASIERSLQRATGGSSGGSSTSGGTISISPRGGRGSSTSNSGGPNQQEIAQALQSTGVYVAPAMAAQADASALAAAVRKHPHGAKVIVLERLPTNNIGRAAATLHKSFNMGKGLLVLASGTPRSVAAYGGNLVNSESELGAIVKANVGTFNAQGYTAGITGILNQHAAAEASANKGANTFLLLLVGVPAGGGYLLWRRAKKGRAEREEQLRTESRDLANKLAPAYEKLDSEFEFALVSQSDPAKQKELREARAQAGEAFSNAKKQLNNASDAASLAQARSSLLYARDSIENATAVLEGRPAPNVASNSQLVGTPTGGALGQGGMQNQMSPISGMASGYDQSFDVAPLGTGYPGARQGYALDFFTSQPTPIVDMVPVEININGQKQRVWASRDSAQRALSGQPQVASVNYGGQQVPWYNAPQQYNPWSDFGSNMVQMIAMNAVINSLFNSGRDVHHYHDYHGPDYSHGGGHSGGYGGGYNSGGYDSGNSGSYSSNENVGDNGGAGVASLDLFGNDSSQSSGSYNDSSSSLDLFGGGGSSWSSDAS